jgi:thymidylate kinase
MFVTFLGCDGSGKSAVIRGLKDKLSAEGRRVITGHWRPLAFAKETAQQGEIIADNPHGAPARDPFSSILKLGWLWLNWWIGWFRIRRELGHNGVLLFDRYHIDLLVDPKRYRYGGPMFLARLASHLMPQPDRVFFLDAEPDVLLSRKQEVSKETLEKSRAAYLELANQSKNFQIVDVSKPLDQVIEEVIREIKMKRQGCLSQTSISNGSSGKKY